MSNDWEFSKISKEINNNNYFSNCYNHLTKLKGIHFLFILIEIFLNVVLELEIIIRDYTLDNNENIELNFISFIIIKFGKLENTIKLVILISFIILFDAIYVYIKRNKIRKASISFYILINILELFIFRVFVLVLYLFFFTLENILFLIAALFLIIHIYLIFNNFLYNHLYYFVPPFIHYPYDEFSSIYDIILIIIKLFLSASATTNDILFSKFCFSISFIIQIFFSFYFIFLLNYHSYLFMKNSFLNLTKVSLFFSNTIIIFIALIFRKNEIMSILFLLTTISVLLINMLYMYFIYNPFFYIIIRRETPMENIFFYLYIISEKNPYSFVIENKINQHYEECQFCNICKNYKKYIDRFKPDETVNNEEKHNLINEKTPYTNNDNENSLKDLFNIVYNKENKYFDLIKELILDYKYNENDYHKKKTYYYINLSFLIYSDYQKNKNLSLNERIILEDLFKDKKSILENNELQINQIFLCNSFILQCKKILSKLKDILNCEINFNKAKNIIDLSYLLMKLKSKEFKEKLFSHKIENISNSKHLILISSIIYEEIYNSSLHNNSQIPMRDNIQILEDIFHNNMNKINQLISLCVDFNNNNCKIIRAGKDLYSYINKNLFDLFPFVFKQFQIDLFMSSIQKHFEMINNQNNNYNLKEMQKTKGLTKNNKINTKSTHDNNNKKDFIEINIIFGQNISSRIYYKLLTLKLTPLFNNNISSFIILDGFYNIHKNTLITLQNFENDELSKETLISVSEPDLENNKEIFSIPFKKYISYQKNEGFMFQKISSFNIELKYFNIYMISGKVKETKKPEKKFDKTYLYDNDSYQTNVRKSSKIQIIEENSSAYSQTKSNSFINGFTNIGTRNNKKDGFNEFARFNIIKLIIYLTLLISVLFLVIECISFNNYHKDNYNNNKVMTDYKELSKLYYQLFSSILNTANIVYNGKSFKIIDPFIEQYSHLFELNNFNLEKMILLQNEILTEKIMEKKSYIVNINNYFGKEKYNELFGTNINFYRITQTIENNKYVFGLNSINMHFSEAILSVSNSFKILVENLNEPISFLNGLNDPFNYLNNFESNNKLNEYQREFYELVINYKVYFGNFNKINTILSKSAVARTKSIISKIYIFISLDLVILVIIGSLMYIYTICLEFILAKLINYLNMTINNKSDEHSFSETFLHKIEILESIMEFHNYDPIKEVQKLNSLYNNYQQFLTSKNKNKNSEMNRKNYKKIEEDKQNELDNIPKSQRIISRKDIVSLGITFKYKLIYYIYLFILLIIYSILIYLWKYYFYKRSNLVEIFKKNHLLEIAIYQAINAYDLMIFHNLTIEQINEIIILNKTKSKDRNAFYRNSYDNLLNIFNNKQQIKKVLKMFKDLDYVGDFTCQKLYELNNETISEIENKVHEKNYTELTNITNNLIQICENTKYTEAKDFRTIYQRHFQYIGNGILSLKDTSIKGLIDHIMNEGILSHISVFFSFVIKYIIKLTNTYPEEKAIKKLVNELKSLAQMSECTYLLYILIALFIFVYFITDINRLCNQIFILKNIFKIFELQE